MRGDANWPWHWLLGDEWPRSVWGTGVKPITAPTLRQQETGRDLLQHALKMSLVKN